MSFNGSGVFNINTAGQPVVSGTVISATAFNALTADLATGLSTCLTKDGQTNPTANLPMANYKFTGLGAGSDATDSANLSQVQSTVVKLIGSVSGADTITGSMTPALAAYAAGQMFYFVAAGDNTGAVTLNINSLGAKNVTKDGTTALIAGDIKSGEVVVVVYDGTRFQMVSPSAAGLVGITSATVTAVGVNAGDSVTSGADNTMVGYNAGTAITSGASNTVVGRGAGEAITNTANNTLIGYEAGSQYSRGNNTFVGTICGRNINSNDNTAIGYAALRGIIGSSTGAANVAVGYSALESNSGASFNVAVGAAAGLSITSGGNNTLVGHQAGYATNALTTGSNNTIIGYTASSGSASASSRIVIGQGVSGTANDRITVGSGANIAELDLDGSDTSWAASSDGRLKENVQTSNIGLDLIASLRPVSYQWKKCKDIDPDVPGYIPEYNEDGTINPDSEKRIHGDGDSVYFGFIAQEARDAIVANDAEIVRMVKEQENSILTVAPGTLIPALVKAIQELKADFDAYKASHP